MIPNVQGSGRHQILTAVAAEEKRGTVSVTVIARGWGEGWGHSKAKMGEC